MNILYTVDGMNEKERGEGRMWTAGRAIYTSAFILANLWEISGNII